MTTAPGFLLVSSALTLVVGLPLVALISWRGAPRWAAWVAALAIAAGVAPWAVAGVAAPEAQQGRVTRRAIRAAMIVEGPAAGADAFWAVACTPAQPLRRRVPPACAPEDGCDPIRYEQGSDQPFRCGFVRVDHTTHSFGYRFGGGTEDAWSHGAWRCASGSHSGWGPGYEVERAFEARLSRDGRAAVLMCRTARCDTHGAGPCDAVAGADPPPLHLEDRTVEVRTRTPALPQPPRGDARRLAAALAAAGLLASLLVPRRGAAPSPSPAMPYRVGASAREATTANRGRAMRRWLLATAILFGAVAAASWATLAPGVDAAAAPPAAASPVGGDARVVSGARGRWVEDPTRLRVSRRRRSAEARG